MLTKNKSRYFMVKVILIFLLSLVSLPALSSSKTLIFPVFTEINKALLSNYSIFSTLSRDNVVLSYSEDDNKFMEEKVLIFNRSTIPRDEVINYTYRYVFGEINSECIMKGSSDIVNQSFMNVYVNGNRYITGDKSEAINFNSVDDNGFESRNDVLLLKSEGKFTNEAPLKCEGEVNFLVELFL